VAAGLQGYSPAGSAFLSGGYDGVLSGCYQNRLQEDKRESGKSGCRIKRPNSSLKSNFRISCGKQSGFAGCESARIWNDAKSQFIDDVA